MEHKIKIKTDSAGIGTEVFVDGVSIAQYLKGLKMTLSVGEIGLIELKCVLPENTEIEFDGACKIIQKNEPCE